MIFREAQLSDIPQIQAVRHSVKENVLSNPSLVTDKDCEDFLTVRGKGWVCEIDGTIVGFAVADLQQHNIWALFVQPEWEGQGIGKQLHQLMLDWYFGQTYEAVWLGTAPHSRAEQFYRKRGWTETGRRPNGEIRFEITYEAWKALASTF